MIILSSCSADTQKRGYFIQQFEELWESSSSLTAPINELMKYSLSITFTESKATSSVHLSVKSLLMLWWGKEQDVRRFNSDLSEHLHEWKSFQIHFLLAHLIFGCRKKVISSSLFLSDNSYQCNSLLEFWTVC